MNIYLKINKENTFDVFDISISQQEDQFAKATLLIAVKENLPPSGTEATLEGDRLYFKGIIGSAPAKIQDKLAEIELIARPFDLKPFIEEIRPETCRHPYWDPLWIKDPHNTEELQDVHPSSLYWDRCQGGLTRSDWFEGRHTVEVGKNFFADSLAITLKKTPFKACRVCVQAHWVQKEDGVENIGPAIKRAFPGGQVSTYTKEALTQKWPMGGHSIGRTGVWILKSKLEETTPISSLYPLYSPPLPLKEGEGALRSYRAKRHWFKPTLWIKWSRHQKRTETLSFILDHGVQSLFPHEGQVATYEITLQNINPAPKEYSWYPQAFYRQGTKVVHGTARYKCRETHTAGTQFEPAKWTFYKPFHTPLGDPARASFFLTSRGYQAAEHAMERAKAILAKSARAVEISFEAPWNVVEDVTTDTTVILKDPRLPQGRIRGKVVSYTLIIRGETGERFGRVTILCAIGLATPLGSAPVPKPSPAYGESGYGEEEPKLRQTPSGLSYFSYDDQVPPILSENGELLKRMTLTHGPDDQEKALQGLKGASLHQASRVLSTIATRLCLYFKDLRTKETLEHTVSVTMATPWSAPAQWGAVI